MRVEFDELAPPSPDLYRVRDETRTILNEYADMYKLTQSEMAEVIFGFSRNIYEKVLQPGSRTKLFRVGDTSPFDLTKGREPWQVNGEDKYHKVQFEADATDRDALRLISLWSGVNSPDKQLDNFFRLFHFIHILIDSKRSVELRDGKRVEEVVLPAPRAIAEVERLLRKRRGN